MNDKDNQANSEALEEHKHLIPSILSDWVDSNTRPINITENLGSQDLIE